MKKSALLLVAIILSTVLSGFGQSILSESFELGIVPPESWSAIAQSPEEDWNGWTANSNAHSGELAAFVNYATPYHSSYLITPQLAISGHKVLSFWYAGDYASDAYNTLLTLEISTTGNAPSDFTVVRTLEFPEIDNEYVNVVVDLTPYNGQNIYIAFHVEDSYGTGVNLDDIEVYEVSDCMQPLDVTVIEVNTHSANLTWAEVSGDVSYMIQYIQYGQSWDNADSVIVESDSAVLTGLQSASNYMVRVRTLCSEGSTSEWSIPVTFMTDCEDIVITNESMWLENFDAIEEDGIYPLPICWDAAETSSYGTPYLSCGYPPASHSGANSLELKGNNDLGGTSIVVLPQFSNNLNTLRLNFFANTTAYAFNYCGTLQVGYITDVEDPTTFTPIETVTPKTESLNRLNSVSYGPYNFLTVTNPTARMAIKFTSNTYSTAWNLDDVTVSLVPECAEPSQLTTTNVQATSAYLSWAAQENQLYDILYWKTGTTDTVIVSNVTLDNGPVLVEDLTPSTDYTWMARAICNDSTYSYAITRDQFTTPMASIELPYEQTFEGDISEITEFEFSGTGNCLWAIGPATGVPDNDNSGSVHAMYISDNQGISNHYSGNGSRAYAVLNLQFPNIQMEFHLGFDFKVNGEKSGDMAYDFFSVYLLDADAPLPSNQEPEGQSLLYHITGYNDWNHADLVLPNVVNAAKKIVFYWENDNWIFGNPPIAVDNITITTLSCARPSNLAADEILANDVAIHWQENGSATAWKVHYRPSGNTAAELMEVIVTDTPATILHNLASNTNYLCFVTALCDGDEESSHSNPLTFRTPCGDNGITILPYIENFTSPVQTGTTMFDQFVPCWSRYYSNTNYRPYVNTEDVGYFGSECLDFNYTPSCSTIAILPMIGDNIPINTLMLNFDVRRGNPALGTLEVGVMTDPSTISTFTPIDTVRITSSNTWENYTLYCDNYTGEGRYIAFRVRNAGTNSVLLDNLTVDYMPNCLPVTNLHVSNITANSATVSWDGDATNYKVYLTGTPMLSFYTDENTTTLTDLQPSSSYAVFVQALCNGESSSVSSPVSFSTNCGLITITEDNPWQETFEYYQVSYYSPLSNCWATPVTAQFNSTIYPAVNNSPEAAHSGDNCVELYGTSNMLVLPTFANDLNTLRLSFWANTTAYSSSEGGILEVGTITNVNNLQSFTLLTTIQPTAINLTGTDSPNADHIIVDLTAATPQENARIALRYTNSVNYVSWYLDDFVVTLTPDCPSPEKHSVTITNIATNEATVSWVDNMPDHDSWFVHYKPFLGSNDDWLTDMVTGTPSITLTGLIANTLYEIYVTTNCTDSPDAEDATFTKYFNTTMGAAPLPFTTDFTDASEWMLENGGYVNQWVIGPTTPTGSTHALFVSSNGVAPSYDENDPAYIIAEKLFNIGEAPEILISYDVKVGGETNSGATYDYDFMKMFFAPSDVTFDTYYDYYDVPAWALANYGTYAYDFSDYLPLTDGTPEPYTFSMTNGNTIHIDAIMPNPNPNPTPASVAKVVFAWVNDNGLYQQKPGAVISNLSVDIVSCPRPGNLTVENVGDNSADISWQAYEGQNSWVLEYKEANSNDWTTISTTSNEYHFVGLTPATAYNIRVATACDDDELSIWSLANFQTNICEANDQCQYTLYMADSYYDGWNDASLTIQQNGVTVGTYTLENGATGQKTISLCNDMTTTLIWNKGMQSGYYDYECSFYLFGPDGTQIYNSPALGNQPSGVALYTFTADCSPAIVECEVPFGLLASSINDTSAFMDWFITGTELSWVLQYTTDTTAEWITEELMFNLYDFANLTPGTTYYVRVKAQCGEDNESDWSDIYSFTTTGGNVEPIEPIVLTQIAMDITETTATLNGAIVDLGNQTILSRGFEWKVSTADSYEIAYVEGIDPILSYSLYSLTPGTNYTFRAFVTTVNTTTYGGLKHFTTLGTAPSCDAPTNLAATDTANESITLSWTDNADASSWKVRYRQENDGEWTTRTAATNPYTITGLAGLTTYEIQVMADCGGGNVSEWTPSIFVSTKNVGIPEYLFNSIVLYPNPTNDVINVECRMKNEEYSISDIQLIDVYGKVIRTVETYHETSLQTRINVSDLAAGMYFVRVTTDQGAVTKTFVKK